MSAISDAIDALATKVEALTSVDDSAIALLTGLADQIRGTAGSVAKANELAAKVEAEAAKMAAAIQANTV